MTPMNALENLINNASEIESRIGYEFKDKSLLALAFVHRSFVNENRNVIQTHNERLEFLGDSVLGMLTAAYLFQDYPEKPEGDLSHLRSRLVEAISCVSYINKLDVEEHLLLSKGEKMNDGRGRESILADLFEAIIGAIYIDGGIYAAKSFLFENFSEEISKIIEEPLRNWKAELQDYAQKRFQETPCYKVLTETGPDHSKVFEISVSINDEIAGVGEGASKKEAQQSAAFNALSKVNQQKS
ncbi:MAG: ribonuclease-3 [Chlamydiales bacterium]|jgi:ribonuclease-3